MTKTMSGDWTHESVRLLAGDRDPVEVITERVRHLIAEAIDAGWSGPPYDPIELATRHLHLDVTASDAVLEARTVPTSSGPRIEFNPNRPRERRRYSVAHEIAHTLFPDHAERVRHRGATHSDANSEDWQLEALCNLAAAEILMPIGSLPTLTQEVVDIDLLRQIRPRFDVSMEAVLIRAVRVADFPSAAFAASLKEEGANRGRFRIDYLVGSDLWELSLPRGQILPPESAVTECSAIGYTARAVESWPGTSLRVEAIGIPPFPWSKHPRVAGLLLPVSGAAPSRDRLTIVVGSALEPRGHGAKVIAHVVNDATANWGGRGFATALRRAWPDVQGAFSEWAVDKARLHLGSVHFVAHGNDITVASMIAQRGFGASSTRRLRYSALQTCLEEIAEFAANHSASVHMPRIGTGNGGGSWPVIEELVRTSVCAKGVSVTIYDLPGARLANPKPTLFEA